jgi:RNA polymerase sigma-70 factor (ECF subfamily)
MLVGIFERGMRLGFDGILPLCFHTTAARDRTGTMQDEQALLNALQDLDPQAITQIHDQYFPVVYRYARYRVADEEVAEDLASETFIRLLEAIHAGRGPKTSLRGWLMGTISNLVNDYYRKIYNRSVEPLHERLPSKSGDPVVQSERLQQVETLHGALAQLTPDQQHVLALRFGSACSLTETGKLMGRSPNAIKQLQFRALAALRKCLQGEFE